MQNIFDQLIKLLKKDERFISSDDILLKNQVQELARKNDPELIKLLLSDKSIKQHFFFKVDDILIFDKEKFIRFISNKQFLPDSYTAFKNKIGLTAGDEYLSENKDVVLVWPYKDCVLEGGMTKEDQSRDEIFYNETLAPDDINRLLDAKVFTNFKQIDKTGEHKLEGFKRDEKGTIKDNLIIKGNNLLALASLKKEFAGKVKLIYIDPPYNPDSAANTFSYNNSFNHTSWLSFMKNRTDQAKKLLANDGFYCVAIDHYEIFYLGVLCDEIFGRENRIGVIAVETNPGGRSDSEFFATSNEFFLIYAKDITQAKINNLSLDQKELLVYNLEDNISKYKLVPLRRTGSNSTPDKRPNLCFPIYYDVKQNKIYLEKKQGSIEIMPMGSESIMHVWRWSKEKILNSTNDIEIKKSKNGYAVFVKDRIKFEKKPKTLWYGSKYDASSHGTKLLQSFDLDGKFSYPKSLYLMEDIIKILTNKDSIVIDYHAGSGTTAHAVFELNKEDGGNRQFILCEQMHYVDTVTKERVKKVIENNKIGDFVYMELAKWNEEWVEKIEKAKTNKELLKIWDEMKETAFLSYKVETKTINANAKEFTDLSIDNQKKFLIECLDKNQLYINYSEIEDKEYGVKKEDKDLNNEFYGNN